MAIAFAWFCRADPMTAGRRVVNVACTSQALTSEISNEPRPHCQHPIQRRCLMGLMDHVKGTTKTFFAPERRRLLGAQGRCDTSLWARDGISSDNYCGAPAKVAVSWVVTTLETDRDGNTIEGLPDEEHEPRQMCDRCAQWQVDAYAKWNASPANRQHTEVRVVPIPGSQAR